MWVWLLFKSIKFLYTFLFSSFTFFNIWCINCISLPMKCGFWIFNVFWHHIYVFVFSHNSSWVCVWVKKRSTRLSMKIDFIITINIPVLFFLCFFLLTLILKMYLNINVSFYYYFFIIFYSTLDFIFSDIDIVLFYLILMFNFFCIIISCSEIIAEKKILGI